MSGQPPGRTIVVGVDGPEQSLRAVRCGATEAGRRHGPLRPGAVVRQGEGDGSGAA